MSCFSQFSCWNICEVKISLNSLGDVFNSDVTSCELICLEFLKITSELEHNITINVHEAALTTNNGDVKAV